MRRTRTASTTHRATGGSMAEESNPIHAVKYASGEKLLEMSTERSAEELRHRYETFEKVVKMIASFASSQSIPSSRTNRQYYKSDQVKFESLSELINGSMPKDEVIRSIYACEPLLKIRFTRDEMLNKSFRNICGLPEFLENYSDERRFYLGEEDDTDDDDAEDDNIPFAETRTGGCRYGYNPDRAPNTTSKGEQKTRYKAVYGRK